MNALAQRRGYVHILARPPPIVREKIRATRRNPGSPPLKADVAKLGKRSWFGTNRREIALRVRGPPSAFSSLGPLVSYTSGACLQSL